MPEQVILHAGPHKTGTSALQRWLRRRASLLAHHGICFPATGLRYNAHHNLAEAAHLFRGDILTDLWAEVANDTRVFITSEIFSGLRKANLAFFARHMPSSQPRVVYMLRQLPALWVSNWSERVKHGLTAPFHEYLRTSPDVDIFAFRAPPLPSRDLGNLADVFGWEALQIGVYDARPKTRFSTDFMRDFLAVDVEPNTVPETQSVNIRMGQNETECLRQLNLLGKAAGFNREKFIRMGRLIFDREIEIGPELLAEMQDVYNRSPKLILSNDVQGVAQEQTVILNRFADRIIDPVEHFLAPAELELAIIDDTRLPRAVHEGIRTLFGKCQDRLQTYRLPGVRLV